MEITLLLSKQIITMGLMLILAFILCKCGILKTEHSKIFSTLSVYVATPAIILNAFMRGYSPERAHGLLLAVLFTGGVQIAWIILAKLLGKPLHLDRIEKANMIFFNGGIGMPIIQAALGTEAVFYTCAHAITQNIIMWTYGRILVSGEKKISIKKILCAPPVISVGIGLIIFFSRVQLPEVITSTVNQLYNINGPLVMGLAGLILAGADLKKCFGRLRNYITVFGRLIFMPMVFIAFIAITGLAARDPLAASVAYPIAIACSTPSAATITAMASMYSTKEAAEESSTLNVLSVIFCLFTIPLISLIFSSLCLPA